MADKKKGDFSMQSVRKSLEYFDTFLELYENYGWMESATESDVKNAFRLTSFLEKLYCSFESRDSFLDFERILCEWWRSKGRASPTDISVFEDACDLMLVAFLKNTLVEKKAIYAAVREYVHCCSTDRLERLLFSLLRDGISCRTVFLALASNQHPIELDTVLLSVWCRKLECGNEEAMRKQVAEMVKDTKHAGAMLKILCTEDDSVEEKARVKAIVLENVLLVMNKEFCRYLLRNVDRQVLISMNKMYSRFLSAFLDFITSVSEDVSCEHVGSHYSWTVKQESAMVSVQEFERAMELLKCLYQSRGVTGVRVRQWLSVMKNGPCCTIWEDIDAVCDS